jgi:parallel beta-helix repeat protein
MKKIVSGAVLALLLISLLALALEVYKTSSSSENIWYVGPPPAYFASIQEAINSEDVLDGDIIEVMNKTYYENVTVNKSLVIRRYSSQSLFPTVDGINRKGVVFNVTSANVEISGFNIRNGMYGIHMSNRSAVIFNNTVSSNVYGVFLAKSYNDTLTENKITGNTYNFGVSGTELNHYIHNIDSSNFVDGKPIYYCVNQHDRGIPSDAGYVAIVNSTGITAEKLYSLQNNFQGILVAYSSEITVKNFECKFPSVYLMYGIDFNNVTNSTISNLTLSDINYGIRLQCSDNNLVTENMVTNYYRSQEGLGIIFDASLNNSIIANNISKMMYSIAFESHSNGNIIFHNNFVENLNKPYISDSADNRFDNGYEGNYWSDYTCEDNDFDGIGYPSYNISKYTRDNCPLKEPWSTYRIFKRPMAVEVYADFTQKLYTFSNSTLGPQEGGFVFNRTSKEISLNVTSGYSGFLNITIPRNWIDGPFYVKIDGEQVEYVFTVNENYTYIYITYDSGKHIVKIKGTERGSITGDLNDDGVVDIFDAVMLARNAGAEEKG